MIKYLASDNNSGIVKIDTDNLDNIDFISNCSDNIDWAYVIPEDGTMNINGVVTDVKVGDVIFKMYTIGKDTVRETILLDGDHQLARNIKANRDYYTARRALECEESGTNCCKCPCEEAAPLTAAA